MINLIKTFKNMLSYKPPVIIIEPVKAAVQSPLPDKFEDFSYGRAACSEPFRLRSGKKFEVVSFRHIEKDSGLIKLVIQIEGEDNRRQYYLDGIWNENELSEFDLVMTSSCDPCGQVFNLYESTLD